MDNCATVGREAVTRFARRLAEQAAKAPLSAAAVERELAAWLSQPQPGLEQLFRQASEQCLSGEVEEDLPRRRSHVYERAIVRRFEHLLRGKDGSDPAVSRRVVLGLTFALTKLIGSEVFSDGANTARLIALEYGGEDDTDVTPEVFADPRMRLVVNGTLTEMARQFVDFPRQLAEFLRLVNGRLSAPQPEGWDLYWTLDRRTALLMLQALYGDLRDELERDAAQVQADYGPDAIEVLGAFLAALDQAMRLADKPWLLKAIGR